MFQKHFRSWGAWLHLRLLEFVPSRMIRLFEHEEAHAAGLFRPSLRDERMVREKAETYFRSKWSPGVYVGNEINPKLQDFYGFFAGMLLKEIESSDAYSVLHCCLSQYERSHNINEMAKRNKLSQRDLAFWQGNCKHHRRALKYIAEFVIKSTSPGTLKIREPSVFPNFGAILICAEEIVQMSALSDQTFKVHPDETELEVTPKGSEIYFDLRVQGFDGELSQFIRLVSEDTEKSSKYFHVGVGQIEDPTYSPQWQSQYLNDSCQADFGADYDQVLRCIFQAIDDGSRKQNTACVIEVPSTISRLSEILNVPEHGIERAFAGFCLTNANLQEREGYDTKQEYRALRRAFFEIEQDGERYFIFSPGMAKECFMFLLKGMAFQRYPAEWKSAGFHEAITELQRAAGTWFETKVAGCLSTLGILGFPSVEKSIGRGKAAVSIPALVGEIDFLGFDPKRNMLVVLEDKLVTPGVDPAQFGDDIKKFATDKGGKTYSDQLRTKVDWVEQNHAAICIALVSKFPELVSIQPVGIAHAIVTRTPSYARFFIK